MTTSATGSFDPTGTDLMTAAIQNLAGTGYAPTPVQFSEARRLLNILAKSVDKEGRMLFRYQPLTIALVAGQQAYQGSAEVIDVDEEMSSMRSGQTARTPVRPITMDMWERIPDRTTPGTPVQVWVNRARSVSTGFTFNFWPVPDTTGSTFEYLGVFRGKDFTNDGQTADFLQGYQDALLFGLTMMLCGPYGQEGSMKIWKPLYDQALTKALNRETESTGLQFAPFAGY